MSHPIEDLVTPLSRSEVRGLPPYNAGLSTKAVQERYQVQSVVRLASNENPFGPGPDVAKALTMAAKDVALYPDPKCSALREEIARSVGVDPSRIVLGNGSENLLEVLCQVFVGPGDRVLTQSPSFGLHEIFPRMMGGSVEKVPVTEDLRCDVDAWCAALKGGQKDPKMVLLCNPSNPVGCLIGRKGLQRLLQVTPAHTLLVMDEAYYEYATHDPDYPDSLVELTHQAHPWIVLRTFSKAWGLAGARVGYGIASDARVVQLLDKVRTPFNVNTFAQAAAMAAWQNPGHMQASVKATVKERDQMAAQLKGMGLRVAPSAANFLFVDVLTAGTQIAEKLLQEGVIVKPWKEPGYERFIRISIGSETDNRHLLRTLNHIWRACANS